MLRQFGSSMINVLRNCIYPDKVSIIHGFAMSVYALLIDFNKIKKKTLQSGSARQVLFIVLRKFLSSVDFLHVNVGQLIISASIFSLIQAGCPPYTNHTARLSAFLLSNIHKAVTIAL